MTSKTSVFSCLRCPVCGADGEIDEDGKTFRCRGQRIHSYDFSRSGYLNLCRAAQAGAGDAKEAVRARSAFLEKGYYQPLSDRVNALLRGVGAETVLDAGCGEGYYTNRIPAQGVLGVDLSKDAVDHAAKTAKRLGNHASFVVASLFELPVRDASFGTVVNLFAPCAETEFARVLEPGGTLLLVGAGERHLMGLKKVLYDTPYPNPGRADLPKAMTPLSRERLTGTIRIEGNEEIRALFSMTPYYFRTSQTDRERLDGLETLETEYDFDIFLYRKDGTV